MDSYLLPHFGQINLAALEEYYDTSIDFNGREIEIDLNFENKTIDKKQMDIVKSFLENIDNFDKKNKKYIEKDFKDEDGDTVKTYLEHHIEEIDKASLGKLIDFSNKSIDPERQLMKSLQLVRVGLYPDSEDQFAIFDYSIGRDLTDYLHEGQTVQFR